jgi:hypothetical protein
MTTYTFPSITPSSNTFELVTNTRTFQSPLTNSVQTVARKGSLWKASLRFNNLTGDDRAEMQAFLTKLNGQQHRFYLPDHGFSRRGLGSVNSVLAGSFEIGKIYIITSLGAVGNETDFTLIGASSNTVGVIFTATGSGTNTGTASEYNLFVNGAGQTGSTLNVDNAEASVTDYFKAGDYIAFNNELHMVTSGCDSTVGGTIAIPIAPPIRKPTDDNDLLDFYYPVLGVFMLAGSTSWDTQPGRVSNFTIEAVEDVLA